VDGSFDDCHRLTKEAFANADVRREVRLTSANSVNIGRLLPQMVYYFHAFAQAARMRPGAEVHVCTPSGNFGNITAGLIAKRAGLPIKHFVAATNINDVVPGYLANGLFEPRASVQTIANAMDVGHPSNFERMRWLYNDSVEAMRADITGVRHTDDEVKVAIREVFERTGYLLDPHSAIGYMGIKNHLTGLAGQAGQVGLSGDRVGIFLATAHPAKFGEVVEPVLGRPVELPKALAEVVAQPRHVLKIKANFEAVRRTLGN
jgi:threonine synthase